MKHFLIGITISRNATELFNRDNRKEPGFYPPDFFCCRYDNYFLFAKNLKDKTNR